LINIKKLEGQMKKAAKTMAGFAEAREIALKA
jgi:hypothetical protein